MQWSEMPWRPSNKMLRDFALLWIAFFAMVGWYWNWSTPVLTSAIFWGAILGVGALGVAYPPLLRPIFVVWMVAAFPIGWCVLHGVLAIVFFGIFTPLAWIFRLSGRDLLQLQPSSGRVSYWSHKPMPADVGRYYRTF